MVSRWRRACSSSSSSPSPDDLAQGGPEARRAVAREADEAGLLVEGPADGLADPEGGVGGELEALAPVELVDGVLEAEVALLDEVEQLHARGKGVAPGHADDQAEVGPDEPVLGVGGGADRPLQLAAALTGVERRLGIAALLDDLGQLTLFEGGEQRHQADFVEVLADRVAHVGVLLPAGRGVDPGRRFRGTTCLHPRRPNAPRMTNV